MKRARILCTLLGAVVLAGCGGGSGNSGFTPSGTGRAAVLLTDSFREDYAHVWATIFHVELTPQTGSPVVLFDNPAGVQIDLKTLRDTTGARFSFLGSAAIPAGTYTGLNVTIGPAMQLFRNGAAVGSPLPVDSSVPKDANGNPVLALTFKTPKTLNAATPANIIIDFNLARFVITASKVLPAIQEGDPSGSDDPARHNSDDYHGTVSALTGTAPNLAFTLTEANGTVVNVSTSASTSLFGAGNLANGSVVDVDATLDTTTQVLVASAVEIPGAAQQNAPQRVSGSVTNAAAGAGTFTLTITTTRGFTPAMTTVNVVTTAATTYFVDNGSTASEADFFAALAATPNVTVTGAYDTASNTFTATTIKIVNHSEDGGWEHGTHVFRPGADPSNWGHGHIH